MAVIAQMRESSVTGVGRGHYLICQVGEAMIAEHRIEEGLDLVVHLVTLLDQTMVEREESVAIHFQKVMARSVTLEIGSARVHFRPFLNKNGQPPHEREVVQEQMMDQGASLRTADRHLQHGVKADHKDHRMVPDLQDENSKSDQLSSGLLQLQSKTVSGVQR